MGFVGSGYGIAVGKDRDRVCAQAEGIWRAKIAAEQRRVSLTNRSPLFTSLSGAWALAASTRPRRRLKVGKIEDHGTCEQTRALLNVLIDTIEADRYPNSSRVVVGFRGQEPPA